MRCSTIISMSITVSLTFTGCTARQSNTQKASFRLTNQATAKPLTNVIVSVYDGFDKTLPPFAGPVRSDNEPYHFTDIRTSTNGTLDLDLSQLKDNTVLITSGELYKYIQHRGNLVTVIHYNREGNFLRVIAHYYYDLKTKLVTVIRFPEKQTEKVKVFTIIDVPMD